MAFGGTKEAEMEKETWPELNRLASSVPEAGIHHQSEPPPFDGMNLMLRLP